MSAIIRTLIIDDSAFVRKLVKEMLSGSPYIEVVGTARDGREALDLVEQLKPDVVTCDLMMPILDGVGFVKEQMARRPLPILILTASPEDAAQVLEALNAGAFDLVQKPTSQATTQLMAIRDELISKVKAAGRAPVKNLEANGSATPVPVPTTFTGALRLDAVVIGISTGGPQALRHFVPEFPADFRVPIAMVLHMPIGYTALFAEKLNEITQLEVLEAREGMAMQPGRALLAPAGKHMTFRRDPRGNVVAQLSLRPTDRNHRPSVDVLFQSAAEIYGSRVLGVVMTGMGDDGCQGAGWIKAQGGKILTEAESSCVIYGMPRTVVEAGLSDRAVTLKSMAQAITEQL